MNTENLKKKNMEIKVDENILLKIIIMEEVSDPYVQWLNDYEVTKFTEQKYLKHTLESTKDYVKKKYYSNNDLLFGIFVKGLHIGNIKLGPIKFEHMSAEVSYFIGEKKFWGKGVATKCLQTIIQYAVIDLGLKKIHAGYYENNIGSARVFQKCGFVVEGIKYSDVIFEQKRINSVMVGYLVK